MKAALPVPPAVATETSTLSETMGAKSGAGTMTSIAVFETTVNEARTDPNLTTSAPVNPEPLIMTWSPAAPCDGVTLLTVGMGR